MNITEQQLQIISQVSGHMIVLAGPGSGKTRTIVEKIFSLFQHDIITEPFGVLAITFTNSAASEMKTRLRQKGFSEWDRLFIGTFHSFSKYLLNCYGSDIGINENFDIADEKQRIAILSKIKPSANDRDITAKLELINDLKQKGIYPGVNDEKLSEEFRQLYKTYQEQLILENLLDFPDLIHFAIDLMHHSDLASRLFRNFFQYIVIDEFQDTDHQQLELVKIFTANAIGSTIVGDDNQSIFSWRGADRNNIEVFRNFFNANMYYLDVNFRSDQVIVEAANAVINQGSSCQGKKVRTNIKK